MKKLTLLLAFGAASVCAFGELLVKDGETLAFLGDSITAQGQRNADGYVNLVLRGLEAEGVKVTAVRAGIGGHKSNDMLKRLDKDVLSKKPRCMTLSCGINDVWHQDIQKGVFLPEYQENVKAILDKCAASNCTVVVMTPTIFEEAETSKHNTMLAPYVAWIREEAKRRGLPLADLNGAMWAAKKASPETRLTADGVHMKFAGDLLMARGVAQALGLTGDRLAVVEKNAWKPVWVLCRFDLKSAGDRASYIAKTKDILAAVRAEKGCREYRLLGDCDTDWEKPQRFGEKTLWMIEKWASLTELKKHLETPHMKKFGPLVRPFRASGTFHVLEDVCE